MAQLDVPELNLRRLRICLIGDSILVTHRFGEHTMADIEKKQTGQAVSGKKGKAPKEPIKIFLSGLHIMPGAPDPVVFDNEDPVRAEGRFGFPTVGIKAAAVRAASACGLKMTEVRQSFFIEGELVEIHTVNGVVMRRDFVRPQLGITDLAYRPEFRDWHIDIAVRYNADVITPAQLVNLFVRAGFGVGIGSWRPEKDGQWGMFHVDSQIIEEVVSLNGNQKEPLPERELVAAGRVSDHDAKAIPVLQGRSRKGKG